MKWLSGLIPTITKYLVSKRAKRDMATILKWSPVALYYIEKFAVLTPTLVDDMAFSWLHREYPRFFNGVPLTDEELGAFRLVAASGEMMIDYPGELTETQARAAVQVSYSLKKAESDERDVEGTAVR